MFETRQSSERLFDQTRQSILRQGEKSQVEQRFQTLIEPSNSVVRQIEMRRRRRQIDGHFFQIRRRTIDEIERRIGRTRAETILRTAFFVRTETLRGAQIDETRRFGGENSPRRTR